MVEAQMADVHHQASTRRIKGGPRCGPLAKLGTIVTFLAACGIERAENIHTSTHLPEDTDTVNVDLHTSSTLFDEVASHLGFDQMSK